MAAEERRQLRPVEGEMAVERLTVPLKPLELVKPTVELPDVPARMVKVVGLVFKAKSGSPVTIRATVVVWLTALLVAVTVIV